MKKEDLEKYNLVKGSSYENDGQSELTRMREQFKTQYALKRGWNVKNLTDEQLLEIKSQKGYQCPGMICG